MTPRMRTRSAGRPVAESRGGGTGRRVGRGGGRGRRPRGGNDDHVDEINGQGNDQGVRARESQWECRGSHWGSTRLLGDHCLEIAEPLTRHASSGW
ncbi:hypothetical protein Tco_1037972 [Tanacetum coccineum]